MDMVGRSSTQPTSSDDDEGIIGSPRGDVGRGSPRWRPPPATGSVSWTHPRAAAAARERLGAALERLVAKGRLAADEADAERRAPDHGRIGERPAGVRARHRGRARGPPRSSGRSSPTSEPGSRPPRCSRRTPRASTSTAIADDVIDPERVIGLHFFNPPAGDGPRRGRARRATSARSYVAAVDLMRRVGQDPGALRVDAGLHRQPGRAAVLRRGAADGRGGRRRPGHDRLDPARAWRVPDGALRADRLHRPGRQPRRRHLRLGADRPRRALRAHRVPAASRRVGPARSQVGRRRLPVCR